MDHVPDDNEKFFSFENQKGNNEIQPLSSSITRPVGWWAFGFKVRPAQGEAQLWFALACRDIIDRNGNTAPPHDRKYHEKCQLQDNNLPPHSLSHKAQQPAATCSLRWLLCRFTQPPPPSSASLLAGRNPSRVLLGQSFSERSPCSAGSSTVWVSKRLHLARRLLPRLELAGLQCLPRPLPRHRATSPMFWLKSHRIIESPPL